MKRGDVIQVRAYPDKLLSRILWEEHATWVMVCRQEVYQDVLNQGCDEPAVWMGFPKEDVVSKLVHD